MRSPISRTINDRNRSNPEVKLIEGVGAFYSALSYQLNQVTSKLETKLLNLLGIELEQSTKATVTLSFTATAAGATILAGTIVKTGTDSDAIKFVTDANLVLGASVTDTVAATAQTAGAAGNVDASTLTRLDEPISRVASVTNSAAASGGQDEESLASAKARAPLAIRALTRAINEDFAYHAARVDGVERAIATAHNGSVSIHILAPDLNETPAGALQTSVETDALARTIPSVVVTALQESIRLVQITEVENEITAVDITDTDGSTILHHAWDWGEDLFVNELIALFDGLDGVASRHDHGSPLRRLRLELVDGHGPDHHPGCSRRRR